VADGIVYAHSLPGEAMDRWESLSDHQEAVAALAAEFAEPFGWAEVARLAGRLHDIDSSGTRHFRTKLWRSRIGRCLAGRKRPFHLALARLTASKPAIAPGSGNQTRPQATLC
jgi:hypothetical protein